MVNSSIGNQHPERVSGLIVAAELAAIGWV
jgi:hypothetical protein